MDFLFTGNQNARVINGTVALPKLVLGIEGRSYLETDNLFCEVNCKNDSGSIPYLLVYPQKNLQPGFLTLSKDRVLDLRDYLDYLRNPVEVLVCGMGPRLGIYEAHQGLKALESRRKRATEIRKEITNQDLFGPRKVSFAA